MFFQQCSKNLLKYLKPATVIPKILLFAAFHHIRLSLSFQCCIVRVFRRQQSYDFIYSSNWQSLQLM